MVNRVYFHIRPQSRERMCETALRAGQQCEALLPNIKSESTSEAYIKNKSSWKKAIKILATRFLLFINMRNVSVRSKADRHYFWGMFPRSIQKPFIVEIDNPYCLTFYNRFTTSFRKRKIKQLLKKAYRLVFISETCKRHSLKVFGDSFEEKSYILYPYVGRNHHQAEQQSHVVNYLFVGTNFKRKGGSELLEAFKKIDDDNVRLTIVSDLSDDVVADNHDPRITFLPLLERERIFQDVYPKMDVLIFPSLYESFGMVLLEALSFGLAIISTRVYASPEMVKDGYNGVLIEHPILPLEIIDGEPIVNCVDLKIGEFDRKYLENSEECFALLSKGLHDAMLQTRANYRSWKKNSINLFEEKFSPEQWMKNIKEIIN